MMDNYPTDKNRIRNQKKIWLFHAIPDKIITISCKLAKLVTLHVVALDELE